MERNNLLGSHFDCECGKTHEVPVRAYLYERGVIEKLPDLIRETAGSEISDVLILADQRTWEVQGKHTKAVLDETRFNSDYMIVPDLPGSSPVCDDQTLAWLKEQIDASQYDLLIAVGSGVINDLTKWAAFDLNLPYYVVATAASMNGYSSANVAAKVNGVKVLVRAEAPIAVLADAEIIANAPAEMTAAGFGDVIAKSQSHADWRMNQLLFDEYYCRHCAELISSLEPMYLDDPARIASREPGAMKGLFEGLFYSGLAMTMVGTSAPASGGEHLFSHTLDMMSAIDGGPHDLHGRQVGVGVLISAYLTDRILTIETPHFAEPPAGIDEGFWEPAGASVVQAVKEQYGKKLPVLKGIQTQLSDPGKWRQLQETFRLIVKKPDTVKSWLVSANAAACIEDLAISRERATQAIGHMHEIRSRTTVVDLAFLMGILPAEIETLIEQWLM